MTTKTAVKKTRKQIVNYIGLSIMGIGLLVLIIWALVPASTGETTQKKDKEKTTPVEEYPKSGVAIVTNTQCAHAWIDPKTYFDRVTDTTLFCVEGSKIPSHISIPHKLTHFSDDWYTMPAGNYDIYGMHSTPDTVKWWPNR